MKASPNGGSRVRFGQFELDGAAERLLKRGIPVRLENQPLQILAALLERPGDLVSREELSTRLWPDGTYVDFDEGINTAIKRLRYALGDSAENPLFIETVPRRGYRFIAGVQLDHVAADLARLPADADLDSFPPHPRWRAAGLIALLIVLAVSCWWLYRWAFASTLHVSKTVRLTNSGRLEPWGRIASDGSRLYFLEREGDHWNSRQISTAGGESMPFGSSPTNTKTMDVSADQSEILFAPFTSRGPDLPLWSMPLLGGSSRRVGEILASAAAFSPDGTQIAFTNTHGVFLTNRDGADLRQLASLPDCWSIAWSPDGKNIRFTQDGPHIWQVTPTGRNLQLFLPSWSAGEGRWTSDGSYYVFTAVKDGRNSLWAVREFPTLPWLHTPPTQITFGPLDLGGGLPSRDGHSIYAMGGIGDQIDVVRFDPASHQFQPLLPGVNVREVAFSPDHQWVLYNDWKQLWRSRPDGSDRLQLAGAPSHAGIHFVRWSPDSKHILFADNAGEKGTIYVASANGGPATNVLASGPSGTHPDWSPDGQTIVFSIQEQATDLSPAPPGLYLFDSVMGRTTRIPGSDGLAFPRWSPDGRFLAAVSVDTTVMKILDLKTHHWSEVAHGKVIGFPVWSSDSVLHFQDILMPGEPVYRFHPGAPGPQPVYRFENILQSGAIRCGFEGFAPDGSLLVQVNRGGADLYALTVSP